MTTSIPGTAARGPAPRPVLVTGASGHLGANLVRRLLADGHPVRVLLHPRHDSAGVDGLPVERAFADIRDLDATRAAVDGCDGVYHCAALLSTIDGDARHRRAIFDSNVVGTRNVLRAARERGAGRCVVTGSFSAVGYDPDDPSAPSNEATPLYPFHRTMPYERSKWLVEHECLRAAADGQDVLVVVCCAMVGGNDFAPSRLGRTLCDYVNGRLRFHVEGGFEFVAARDIVDGHVRAMARGRAGQRYIVSSEFLTLDDLLDHYDAVAGVRRRRRRLPGTVMYAFSEVASFYLSRVHPDFPQRLTPGAIRLLRKRRHADTSKARRELGFEPTPIRDAVAEAYAFHHARGAITEPRARDPVTGDLPGAAHRLAGAGERA